MQYDVAIIGGGAAGLQAALTLARSHRTVLLMDAGHPRHRFANHMHNLLGADGLVPADFYARAQADLANYPNVTTLRTTLHEAQATDDGFTMTDADGATHAAHKLLFACGITDHLPNVPGIAEGWGTTVLHCTYCHGYELAGKTVAALTTPDAAVAKVESLWQLQAKLHFFFERDQAPDEELKGKLRAHGITVMLQSIERIEHVDAGLNLVLDDGSSMACAALFVKPVNMPSTIVPFQLGCQPVENAYIAVNDWNQTHVKNVYAAGDIAGGFQQFATALNSGLRAAVMINTELTREALA